MQTKNRIRRTTKRFAQVLPRRRESPLAVAGAMLAEMFHGELPTAGANDSKHFETIAPGEELIPMLIPRADLATITSALCQGNLDGSVNRARINLSLRLAHMRQDRIGQKPLITIRSSR